MRNTLRNTMLGMTLVAGLLGTGAVAANAAPQVFHGTAERGERGFDGGHYRGGFDRPVGREFEHRDFRPIARPIGGFYGGVYGGGVATDYIPPCPGDGYFWTAGYYNGGYWVPGAWAFRGRGYREGFRGYAYARDNRGFDRGGHGFDHRGRR